MAFGCAALVMVMNPPCLPSWVTPHKSPIPFFSLYCYPFFYCLFHKKVSSLENKHNFLGFVSHKYNLRSKKNNKKVCLQNTLNWFPQTQVFTHPGFVKSLQMDLFFFLLPAQPVCVNFDFLRKNLCLGGKRPQLVSHQGCRWYLVC